jgi:hypothetical protein
MNVIRDRDGNVIRKSRNLRGIRRYVAEFGAPAIKTLAIDPTGEKGLDGKLSILFADGSSYETNFASYSVLCEWVRRWRNVHGAPLLVGGKDCGEVTSRNPYL